MITILETEAKWSALGPEWAALAPPHPFGSPAWLLPWWRVFGTGRPVVAVRREDGVLRGLLPLYLLDGRALPIGAGTSDLLGPIGASEGLLQAALAWLGEAGIERCDLFDIPADSPLVGTPVTGWTATWGKGSACPVLDLSAPLPSSMRRKVAMARHRAARAGPWRVDTAGPSGLAEFLEVLATLHGARWSADGEAGVLADPAVARFWQTAAPDLAAAGLLRAKILRLGTRPIAAVAALLGPGRLYFYLSGYDPAEAFISPGTLLVAAMLEEAISEGRREANFLRGRESYKYRWGAIDRFSEEASYLVTRSPSCSPAFVD